MHKPAQQQGFTLVELLIVVAIIGLLAAIAIPNLVNAVNRARQTRTVAEIRTMATAVQLYEIDNGYVIVSTTPTDLAVYKDFLVPTYVRTIPLIDGWFNSVLYTSDGESYTITSYGLDRAPTVPSGGYIQGPINRFIDDIVFSRGIFVQYPEGAQS